MDLFRVLHYVIVTTLDTQQLSETTKGRDAKQSLPADYNVKLQTEVEGY